jgi:Putative phage metallopeptidase
MSATATGKLLVFGEEPEAQFVIPHDDEFKLVDDDDVIIEVEFLAAPTLAAIGQALIEKRTCFEHLRDAKIHYLWKRKGGKSKGNLRYAYIQKPTGLLAYFSAMDYVVWAGADNCRAALFTWWQMEATMFHELKHSDVKETEEGETSLILRGHDWEGFVDEAAHYGPWRPTMTALQVALHPTLFDLKGER